jgi:hypothetical protein
MSRFHHLDDAQRPPIAVPRNCNAAQFPGRKAAIEIMRFRDLGHRAARLAGGEHDQRARGRRLGKQ